MGTKQQSNDGNQCMKDQSIEWSRKLKEKEEALYEHYKDLTRKLLKRKKAEDLLPMLGLDKEGDDD